MLYSRCDLNNTQLISIESQIRALQPTPPWEKTPEPYQDKGFLSLVTGSN